MAQSCDHAEHARRDERRRIAAEIHDDTIQTIVATGLALARLGRKYPDPEIAEIEVRVRSAVSSLRHLVFDLEPDVNGMDLPSSLRSYLERSLGDHDVEISIACDLEEWPRGAALSVLFRNCREAAINAVRHGQAQLVEISISIVNGMLVTLVLDNGKGCANQGEAGSGHLGVKYMRRRAQDEGGTFTFSSVPGIGSAVGFTLQNTLDDATAPCMTSTAAIHAFGVSVQ